jgi:predicted nucleic acid-binding Zn ribbon protein
MKLNISDSIKPTSIYETTNVASSIIEGLTKLGFNLEEVTTFVKELQKKSPNTFLLSKVDIIYKNDPFSFIRIVNSQAVYQESIVDTFDGWKEKQEVDKKKRKRCMIVLITILILLILLMVVPLKK